MRVLILSAGFGTRMQEFTQGLPKSLLPLCDKKVIDLQIEKVIKAGLRNVTILTNSKFVGVFKEWRTQSFYKKYVDIMDNGVSEMDRRRGVIGDLHFFTKTLRQSDSVLVLGSDNLFDGSLKEIIRFFQELRGAGVVGIHLFKNTNFTYQENEIVIDQDTRRALALRSKPTHPISPYLASMLYFLPASMLFQTEMYLREGHDCDNAGNFIAWLIKSGFPILGYEMPGRRFDTGSPTTYRATISQFPCRNRGGRTLNISKQRRDAKNV
jgi:glucose-1-phosphate thymidylyltransferase